MLAARDQENLVHARQTTAASKPLNQGTRQPQPKTPGTKAPKTPFRVPVNDENNPLALGTGKQTVRGTRPGIENTLKTGKDGLRERQPLATPAGPRNRAPLGMKTTNAKAKAFQTPAPPSVNTGPAKSAKRSSTARKLKQPAPAQQSQPEHKERGDADEDRDIEYMPPKPQPLPDIPDDIVYDTQFPQFKGRNFGRGWDALYKDDKVGEDGLTRKEREYKKASDAYDKQIEEMIQKDVGNMELLGINVQEFPHEQHTEETRQESVRGTERKVARKPAVDNGSIPTFRSRNAAQALSQKPRTTDQAKPEHRPSTAAKPRNTAALSSRKKVPEPSNPSAMRHTAALVNSKNTVGYSKGRNVSSALGIQPSKPEQTKKDASSNSILSPEKYMELYGDPPFGSEMWSRCKAAGCFDPEPDRGEEFLESIPPVYEDEETANFQLTL